MIAVPAIARNAKNYTGQYLKPVLARRAKGRPPRGGVGPRNGLRVYSIPGESRSLRPRLNRASPSPARQRIIIAQVGSSGTGSALLTLEAEAGAELLESGGGGKSPRS